MLSMLAVVLSLAFGSSVVAQTSTSVICVAGQCVQSSFNTSIGAKLSAPGAAASIQLLPGQYTTTTSPQLLHSLLTSSSASLNPSPGFQSASLSSLPLNLALDPGIAIYSQPLYSGQAAFSELPSAPLSNNSVPLSASSIALSNNVWAAVSSGSANTRVVFWDSVPDITQLPKVASTSLTLHDLQSAACSPPCAGSGVCSASGTCTCPPGFTGQSCESCAEGFFGPGCQPCPSGCASCDQGISGSGRCLTPVVSNAPETCNCLNGQCGSNGQCECNAGWTTAGNGTQCAKCSTGFFQTSTGDCQVCQVGCTQCSDGTAACISCKQGFTQNPNDPTKCTPLPSVASGGVQCPDGSFSAGAQCTPCSSSCRTCTGPSSTDCILCAAGSFLFNGNCVTANTDGVCQGTNGMIADNNKQECDTCGAKCTSCQIPNFNVASTVNQLQCTGCLPGFVLSNGKCVDSCPAGSFVNPQDNLTCIPCSSQCTTCAGSADFCLTCSSGLLASSGQCVSNCPSNTFTPSSNGSCQKCHPDCASCSGSSFNQCSTCPPDRPVLSNGRCLPTCAKSQYFDTTTSTCQTCDSSCSSCVGSGPSNCLACSSTTQVLRSGACVDAKCTGTASVIPGLGICLSELAPSATTGTTPLPTITGISDPVIQGRRLQWWEILLMALGCAFIFVVILMCCRRRARKKRVERTKAFAFAKKINNPRTWKERLVHFGERFFGHRNKMYPKKSKNSQDGDILPMAYASRSRPNSVWTVGPEPRPREDVKQTFKDTPAEKKISAPLKKSRRETVEDFIDSYDYSRSSRAPSTLPDLDQYNHHQRRIERESLYAAVTGKSRNTPEPREPIRREAFGASNLSRNTTTRTHSSESSGRSRRDHTGRMREGVLVNLEEEPVPSTPPLQMRGAGATISRQPSGPTEAQAYASSVRPALEGYSLAPALHNTTSTPFPAINAVRTGTTSTGQGVAGRGVGFGDLPNSTLTGPAATGGASAYSSSSPPQLPPFQVGMPIQVTLTPNMGTGGQGSYWLSPVIPPQQTGYSGVSALGMGQMPMPMQFQLQPNQQGYFQSATSLQAQSQQQEAPFDTIVIQPMHTGGSSRNPFRQGST